MNEYIKKRNELIKNPLLKLEGWNFTNDEYELIKRRYLENIDKMDKVHFINIKYDSMQENYIVSVEDQIKEIYLCNIPITEYNE